MNLDMCYQTWTQRQKKISPNKQYETKIKLKKDLNWTKGKLTKNV